MNTSSTVYWTTQRHRRQWWDRANPNHERRTHPGYTDLAALVQMAKARGWSNNRIVREMSAGLSYADALNLARKAAPLLDISISEFMRLRKNE